MKSAVISGATGAIGTALTKKLVEEGIDVLILCREDSRRIQNIIKSPRVKVEYCALEDLSDITNNTGNEYDVFYHFAWAGASGPGRNDMYMQNNNVKCALDAVTVAKKFGCKVFIGAGSQAEYGRVEGLLRPDTPVFPEMGYGYAKLCAGQMTRDYAHQLGLKHIWTRILSVYGPNDGSQSMIMSTINKLIAGETPQFTKGEQLWDYLYSSDAANAFYLLGNKGIDGKIYVLGSGQAKPLANYIEIVKDEVNPQAKIELGAIPYNPKQVMHLQADIRELKKDTGFEPQINFREGIRKILKEIQ